MTKSKANLTTKRSGAGRKGKSITRRRKIEPRLKVEDGILVVNFDNPEVMRKIQENLKVLKEWAEAAR